MLIASMFFQGISLQLSSFNFLIFIITATKYLVSRVDVAALVECACGFSRVLLYDLMA